MTILFDCLMVTATFTAGWLFHDTLVHRFALSLKSKKLFVPTWERVGKILQKFLSWEHCRPRVVVINFQDTYYVSLRSFREEGCYLCVFKIIQRGGMLSTDMDRDPTRTGKPGKMGRHFPVREKSGNFEQTGKVRENHTKYWKTQGI